MQEGAERRHLTPAWSLLSRTAEIVTRNRPEDAVTISLAGVMKLPVRPFPEERELYYCAAPFMQNRAMVDYADALVVVWDGNDRYLRNLIRNAEKQNLLTRILQIPPRKRKR